MKLAEDANKAWPNVDSPDIVCQTAILVCQFRPHLGLFLCLLLVSCGAKPKGDDYTRSLGLFKCPIELSPVKFQLLNLN